MLAASPFIPAPAFASASAAAAAAAAASSSCASSSSSPLPAVGRVVVLRRDAAGAESEGGALPFEAEELVFGRDAAADVRIRLAAVSRVALRLVRVAGGRGAVALVNTSSQASQVELNGAGAPRGAAVVLRHGDVFAVGGRAFRFDYGESQAPLSCADGGAAATRPTRPAPLSPSSTTLLPIPHRPRHFLQLCRAPQSRPSPTPPTPPRRPRPAKPRFGSAPLGNRAAQRT